jgi:hypothetical protein
MQDAAYLRSQAELCLRIAHELTDNKVAASFGAAARRYSCRALETSR